MILRRRPRVKTIDRDFVMKGGKQPPQDRWDKPGLTAWYVAATVVMFVVLVVVLAYGATL